MLQYLSDVASNPSKYIADENLSSGVTAFGVYKTVIKQLSMQNFEYSQFFYKTVRSVYCWDVYI